MPAEVFVKDPDSLCSTVTWKDEEDRTIWVYRVQVGRSARARPGGGLADATLIAKALAVGGAAACRTC